MAEGDRRGERARYGRCERGQQEGTGDRSGYRRGTRSLTCGANRAGPHVSVTIPSAIAAEDLVPSIGDGGGLLRFVSMRMPVFLALPKFFFSIVMENRTRLQLCMYGDPHVILITPPMASSASRAAIQIPVSLPASPTASRRGETERRWEAAEPANRQPPRKRTRCGVMESAAAEVGIGGAVVEHDSESREGRNGEEMMELGKWEAAEPANRQPPRKRRRCAVMGSTAAEVGIGGAVAEHDSESYGPDVWTEVAKHLCPVRLLNLSATCRWMHRLLDDTIWRHAFFRDLNLAVANTNSHRPPHRSWRLLYLATFDGSHAYWLHWSDQHINAYRIGGLLLDSADILLTVKLPLPKLPVHTIETTGALVISNARCGVWIIDMHLLKCPLCDHCDGNMLVMDARHCDLFFEKFYRDGTWKYADLGKIEQVEAVASCAVFNAKRLSSPSISGILNPKSWTQVNEGLNMQSYSSTYVAAISSNLQQNKRLESSFKEMRDSAGEIVSIRISQQLLK